MGQLSARRTALVGLQLWRSEGGRADAIVSDLLNGQSMSAVDRAFTLELFYGVLRNLMLLDFWISRLRPSHVEVDLRDILRLGLYQLLVMGMPEHAAVNESVELAVPKARGLINGVLRTAVREREELQRRTRGQPLSLRESHPDFLISRWQKAFGAEATAALCKWNNRPPPIYARINLLKIDGEQFKHRYPETEPSEHGPEFVHTLSLPADALKRGHCYIQDPSTAVACRLLDPQPGEKILDACAAPGGKSGYVAAMMQNRGVIIATDRDPSRVQVLKENMSRLGAEIVQSFVHDWRKTGDSKQIEAIAPFDRILIDAPCTNTGVMRRRVDLRWRLQPADFIRMQEQQLEITQNVSRLLKPEGVLVYSTCSLEPEENEVVVNRLLDKLPGTWRIDRKYRRPFEDRCDGAFAAQLRRTSAA